MQHLTMEELARLVSERASEDEAGHLAICADCSRELEEMERQMGELRAMDDLSAPVGGWNSLAARLAAEGLVSPSRAGAGIMPTGAASRTAILRMAAAVALFVSGGVANEVMRAGPAEQVARAEAEPRNATEAGALLAEREADYVAALALYGELTGEDLTDDPVNRLAALEGIVLTTRAALQDAPADPVINGYHLTALTQREAMLRQITDPGDGWY